MKGLSTRIRKLTRLWERVSKSVSVAKGLVMRFNTLATHISGTQQPRYLYVEPMKHLKLAEIGKYIYMHYFVPLWEAARVTDNPNKLLRSSLSIHRRARMNTGGGGRSLNIKSNNKR